jgi:predicted phosphodiesterase
MTQKYRIVSDWHLECYSKNSVDISDFIDISYDCSDQTLLIAGDYGNDFSDDSLEIYFLSQLIPKFHNIVMVLGNHEYYNNNIHSLHTHLSKNVFHDTNITLLNNEYLNAPATYDTIIGSTFWTNFNNDDPLAKMAFWNFMSDTRFIFKDENKTELIRPDDIHKLHTASLKFIEYALVYGDKNKKGSNNIIMTHHAPSPMSCHAQYKNSILNGSFYSDYNNFILDHQPAVWIHGHTHSSHDYMLGDTRIICNPRGYFDENLVDYNPNLVIEL